MPMRYIIENASLAGTDNSLGVRFHFRLRRYVCEDVESACHIYQQETNEKSKLQFLSRKIN